MSKNRTNVDWSKHVLTIEEHPEAKQIVHYFAQPGTICQSIKFINVHGIMAVTGDYGNWIFCREFVPSAKSDFVSDGYWEEKLRIASEQDIYKYDPDETTNALQAALDNLKEDFEDDADREDALAYYQECLDAVEDEFKYRSVAVESLPPGWDYESIIFKKKRPIWLSIIFDAYDEIVKRLKAESLTTV